VLQVLILTGSLVVFEYLGYWFSFTNINKMYSHTYVFSGFKTATFTKLSKIKTLIIISFSKPTSTGL
jgi:hypothetical protein